MRVETNEDLVKRNKQIATYLFFFSLAVLILGFLAANGSLIGIDLAEDAASIYLIVMPAILVIGLMSTLVSVRMTNMWVRQPRPEDAIQTGLKGISTKSVLYNYLHLPARHVLICPQGVFAIITRYQDSKFSVDNDKWKTHRNPLGRILSIFRMDGVENPTAEARLAADHIQQIMDDLEIDVEVQPLIIFVDPRAELEIGETSIPVLYAVDKASVRDKEVRLKPNLKEYMRSIPKEEYQTLTPEEIEAFEDSTIEFEEVIVEEE